MDTHADKLADIVFKRSEGTNDSHDTHTFNVLMAIDGIRSVGTIAREDHYELEDLSAVIARLVETGAIKPVQADDSNESRDTFFNNLEEQLSMVMGPVSNILIQDNVSALGCNIESFPMSKAKELIGLISRSIPDKSEADAFVRRMSG